MEVARVSASRSDEAEAAIRPFFPTVSFGSGGGRRPLRFELVAHAAHGTVLLEYTIGGPSVRGSTEMPGFTVSETSGEGVMIDGRDPIDSAGKPYAVPHHGMRAEMELVHARAVQVDEEAVRRFARVDLGDDRFELRNVATAALSPAAGALWSATADYTRERMLDGSADSPLVGSAISQMLVSTYLSCFRTTWTDAERSVHAAPVGSAAVRRAATFMDENRHLPIEVADVAEAARLSVRGLQTAFRRERGQTPMQYLRRARLDAAHQALLEADGASDTVEAIARRWGFGQLGRFASRYREAFGELPSTTLRG